MKWYNFLSFLVAAGMFSACNDDLENSGNENGDTSSSGSGYVKIAINLPTTSGSSSRANDNFDGGLPAEYKVNDLILALFYGTDETSATCKWAKNLTNSLDFSTPGTATDNVTTRSDYMISDVPKPGTDQNVYALAIVNNSGYFGVSGADLTYGVAGTLAKFTGKLTDLFANASVTDLSKIASTDNGGNFMMTNAPISDKVTVTSGTAGWDPQITTLVKLDVYDDEPSAESATPNPIYVERVAAKVNVKINSSNNILTVGDDGTDPGATVEFGGWVLQNTNKKIIWCVMWLVQVPLRLGTNGLVILILVLRMVAITGLLGRLLDRIVHIGALIRITIPYLQMKLWLRTLIYGLMSLLQFHG